MTTLFAPKADASLQRPRRLRFGAGVAKTSHAWKAAGAAVLTATLGVTAFIGTPAAQAYDCPAGQTCHFLQVRGEGRGAGMKMEQLIDGDWKTIYTWGAKPGKETWWYHYATGMNISELRLTFNYWSVDQRCLGWDLLGECVNWDSPSKEYPSTRPVTVDSDTCVGTDAHGKIGYWLETAKQENCTPK